MFDFLETPLFQGAILLLLVVFVAMTLYGSFKTWRTFHQQAKVYTENHKDAVFFKDTDFWWIFEAVLGMLAILFAFMIPNLNQSAMEHVFYVAGYICIGILFLGIAFDNFVRKRVFFSKDSFFYIDETIRYRSIREIVDRKRMLLNRVVIIMNNNAEIEVTKKVGEAIKEHRTEWKKHKKERHK